MAYNRKLIVLILIVIGVCLVVYFRRSHPLECKRKTTFEKLKEQLETGDLLILSGSTIGENAIKTYTLWDFSHSALVIRERTPERNGEVWLWESDIGQHYKDGPRAVPLHDKLKRWKGDSVVRVCKTGLNVDPNKLLSVINELLPQSMDYEMWSWMFGPSYKSPKTWFCSELVVHTLNNTTKWKSKDLPLYYSPKRLMKEMVDDLGATYQDYEPIGGVW